MAALRLISMSACFRRPLLSLISSPTKKIIEIPAIKDAVIVRNMSSHNHRVIQIGHSKFEWRKFKDHLHFYILLGVIPLCLLVTATNIFIGPAELADTPEGYEPKYWEYYQHPISRFIARHSETPEHRYERNLHFIAREQDLIRMRKLERRVKELMGLPDFEFHKKWYMVPLNKDPIVLSREKTLEANIEKNKFFYSGR